MGEGLREPTAPVTPAALEESSLSLDTCSRAPMSSQRAREEKCLQRQREGRGERGEGRGERCMLLCGGGCGM